MKSSVQIIIIKILKVIIVIIIYLLRILRIGKRDNLKSIRKDVDAMFEMLDKALKQGKPPT